MDFASDNSERLRTALPRRIYVPVLNVVANTVSKLQCPAFRALERFFSQTTRCLDSGCLTLRISCGGRGSLRQRGPRQLHPLVRRPPRYMNLRLRNAATSSGVS